MLNYQDNYLSFSGELTFGTTQKCFEQLVALELVGSGVLVADFSAVLDVDTSALALCLALQRKVKNSELSIRYLHVPPQMHAIATSVGVQSLFDSL